MILLIFDDISILKFKKYTIIGKSSKSLSLDTYF